MFAISKKVWPVFLALGLGLALTSCEEKETPKPEPEPDPIETPTLTLNKTEVLAPKDGGSFSVEVTVTNPIEGQSIEVAAPQVEWITDVDTSIENIIQFAVVENTETEVREATFTISYTDAEPVSFVVKQEAGDPIAFVYENLETGLNEFAVDIIPADKTTPYIFFTADLAYIQEFGLEDDDALFEDDMVYFEQMAPTYGMTLAELLQAIAHTGDQRGGTTGLSPQTDYVGYAYHIDIENQERLSDIIRLNVTTEKLPLTEVDFDVTIDVRGPNATAHVTPVDYDGHYNWIAIDAAKYEEALGDEDMGEYIIRSWATTVDTYLYYGYSVEFLLSQCKQGVQSIDMIDMDPLTDYVFGVFAVSEETAYPCSEPLTIPFTTEDIPESDLFVEINIKEVQSRSCVVDFIASNDTDPYFGSVLLKEYYESFGATDEERLAFIAENYYVPTSTGTRMDQHFEELAPETEYVALAFGFIGDTVNTPLYKEEFCTSAEVQGKCVLTWDINGYYDASAIAALDENFAAYAESGAAILASDVMIEPDSEVYYYNIFHGQNEGKTDAEWIESLISQGKAPRKPQAFLLDYDIPLTFAGFAVDEEGNYGPLYLEYFVLTRDNVGDPQDFLEWYYNAFPSNSQMAMPKETHELAPYTGGLTLTEQPLVREQSVSQSGRMVFCPVEKLDHAQSQRKVQVNF